MKSIKLKRPVWVEAEGISNIQFLMEHPLDGSLLTFNIANGKAETADPYILRCLLDHPLRNTSFANGGFVLIGSDEELEALYADAVGVEGAQQNPLQSAQDKVKELEAEVARLQTIMTPSQKQRRAAGK